MRPKLAGCRVRGRKTCASVQLVSDHSLWLCHWPTEHLCAGQVLGASYGNARCQNDLFRSDPRLEISTLGRGFWLQDGVVSGLVAGRVGFLAYHSPGRVPCTLFHRKQAEGLIPTKVRLCSA